MKVLAQGVPMIFNLGRSVICKLSCQIDVNHRKSDFITVRCQPHNLCMFAICTHLFAAIDPAEPLSKFGPWSRLACGYVCSRPTGSPQDVKTHGPEPGGVIQVSLYAYMLFFQLGSSSVRDA